MADLEIVRPSWGEGNIRLASPITVGANAALDDRLVVDTYDSLYAAGTFTSIYPGMAVATKDTGDIYVYVGPRALEGAQVDSNWKKVGDISTVTTDLAQVKKDVATNASAIAKEVTDRQNAIKKLDGTVEKSDKGVAVKIVETDGKLIPDSSSLTVTPGTIGGATDGNVVTGTVVKTYVDKYVDTQIKSAVASTYKVKGCVAKLTDLDKITEKAYGDVYNIQEAFDLAGKPYPAGTNVVWAPAETNGDTGHTVDHWDALGGTINLEPYAKTADIKGSTTGTGVVRTVSLVDGKLTGTASALVAADIPALAISKINGLQTALNEKATTTSLAVTGNVSDSVKGVTVEVNETNGKVAKPVVKVADGAVTSGNGNLVTGGVVYSAIESAKTAVKNDVVVKNPGTSDPQIVTGNIEIAGSHGLTVTDSTGYISNISSNQISVAKHIDGEDETNGEILIGATSIISRDHTDGAVITVTRNSDKTGIKFDQDGSDILIEGVASPSKDTDAANKEYVDNAISNVNIGVQSFGGQAGVITANTETTIAGTVKFSMNGKQLNGAVQGLGSAAYTAVSDYATKAQGVKADSSVQNVSSGNDYIFKTIGPDIKSNEITLTLGVCTNIAEDKAIAMNKVADAKAVKTYVDGLANNYATAAQGAKADNSVQYDTNGKDVTIAGSVTAGEGVITSRTDSGTTYAAGINPGRTQTIQFAETSTAGVYNLYANVRPNGGVITFFNQNGATSSDVTIGGIATPKSNGDVANKKYVDDQISTQVTSALTWEVI